MQPASTSAEMLQCYEFIGVLMGISLLQKETVLGINVCSVVWKQLVQQMAEATDLAAFDEMCPPRPASCLICLCAHSVRHMHGGAAHMWRAHRAAGSVRV